jgi:hypothetical protein
MVGVLLERLSLLGSNAGKSARADEYKIGETERRSELLQFLLVGKGVGVGNLQKV